MGNSVSEVAAVTGAVVVVVAVSPLIAVYAATKAAYNGLMGVVSKKPETLPPAFERAFQRWRDDHNMAFETTHWKHYLQQKVLAVLPDLDMDKYNLVFTGSVKAGKSSLLNGIRQLKDRHMDDPVIQGQNNWRGDGACLGPATIGETECTSRPSRYAVAALPHVVLWDMPGADTQTHQTESYYNDKRLFVFDCVCLVVSGAFKHCDILIMKEAWESKQPFAVVRTKADNDIQNLMRGRRMSREAAIAKLRSQVDASFKEELLKARITDDVPGMIQATKFFFVSRWAFPGHGSEMEEDIDEARLLEWMTEVAQKRLRHR